MKKNDKVIIYQKTVLSTFESNLTNEGIKIGLNNILPITGNIHSFSSMGVNIILDEKSFKFFINSNLCFNKIDFVVDNDKWLKDEDFII